MHFFVVGVTADAEIASNLLLLAEKYNAKGTFHLRSWWRFRWLIFTIGSSALSSIHLSFSFEIKSRFSQFFRYLIHEVYPTNHPYILGTYNLWNILPSSCFPESYNLPSFESKIKKLDLISLSSWPSAFFFLPLLRLCIGHHCSFPQHNSLKKIKKMELGYLKICTDLCGIHLFSSFLKNQSYTLTTDCIIQ